MKQGMIRKNLLAIVSMLTTLTFTALAQQPGTGGFKLSGSIAPNSFGKVYLYYEKDNTNKTDSAEVVDGRFSLSGALKEPVFARLSFQPSDTAIRRLNILNFYLEPGNILVSSADSLKNVVVSGSESDKDFLPIRQALAVYSAKFSALNKEVWRYRAAEDTASLKTVISKMDKLEQDLKDNTYKRFVVQHPASLVSLYALSQVAGYHLAPEAVEPLFLSLTPQVRSSKAGKRFAEKIAMAKVTSIGHPMPDFSQADTSGKLISLSSFRGKYLLIDFWASWCVPCRRENPNLVKTFNTFKDKGFTILGVSLDKNKASWIKAIQTDQLYWTQVSDLKYWDNVIAKRFDIRSIPQNILVDPSGKIIARNLHGEELARMLAGILR